MTDQRITQDPQVDLLRIAAQVRALAADFQQQRAERQQRRTLDPADFDRLSAAGVLVATVPVAYGGLWEGPARSTRGLAELFRTLAQGDSSVALVASMHPAVMGAGGWLRPEPLPSPYRDAWEEQKRWVFGTALAGAWWSTITSEPGSGGDTAKTQAVAQRGWGPDAYRVSGLKHFGSGTGIASYMITTAIPEGEDERDLFILDMRGVTLDGSAGANLVAPWDGHGMTATQSHMVRFDGFPAQRAAAPTQLRGAPSLDTGMGSALWPAIMTGIVQVAMETARATLGKREAWRPFEQVEWSRAEVEAWLIDQAYEGMLRDMEAGAAGPGLAKVAIAELAESVTQRLCRVVGGGTYGRHSPFGHWFEDVRALGFLRPPWGMAFDNLFMASWGEATPTPGSVSPA